MAALGRPFCLEDRPCRTVVAGARRASRAHSGLQIRCCLQAIRPGGGHRHARTHDPDTTKFPPHPNQRRHPMTFEKGESGNPAGRARGSRNKRTLLAEHLLEGDTEAIVRTMIERAKEGDMAAVRLWGDRLCPRLT